MTITNSLRRKKCLIVYHFFAHYRQHLMHHLMQHYNWDFEMVSSVDAEAGIKGIEPALSRIPIKKGGLNWSFVKNLHVLGRHLPFLWQRGLLKRLNKNDYDVVIFLGNMYFLSTWAAFRKLRRLNKPILLWTHGFLGKDIYPLRFLRNVFYRQADAFLLYGNRAKELMLQFKGYDKKLLKVIYNSIDYSGMENSISAMSLSKRREVRAQHFHNAESPVLVAVGRTNSIKRFDMLIEAVRLLDARKVNVNCVIIGDGPNLKALRQQAKESGVADRIYFTGQLYGTAVDELLLCCDICVIPGNVGLSAMHAMSAGLPVISHDSLDLQMPEHEAIIEGETGSFYKYGSVESLTDVIEDWIQNWERIAEARENCRERIHAHFHVDYQVDAIMDVLDQLVENRNES